VEVWLSGVVTDPVGAPGGAMGFWPIRADAGPFRSDRSWRFDLGPDELWERIAGVEHYADWWPWLRSFDPSGGLAPGARWRCEVSPPLPYIVRFTVHIRRVERVPAGRRVHAIVDGDVRGEADLQVEPDGPGAAARLRSALEPANPLLRSVGRVARPAVEWGHDWVLDEGRRQFVASLGGPHGPPG
jgi:hypothetical protein